MGNEELVTREQFLADNVDYSDYLVHLTRKSGQLTAHDILLKILNYRVLNARRPYCICSKNDLEGAENVFLRRQLSVVCFTETPLDHIKTLFKKLKGRQYQPEPHGLVFTKKFIREHSGNPVFYMTHELAEPIRRFIRLRKNQLNTEMRKLIALTSVCDEGNDWHWEREWRIVGELRFKYTDIYCGLCPENELSFFRSRFKKVHFIDPGWGNKKLIDELVKKEPTLPNELPLEPDEFSLEPDDITF